MHSAVFHSNMSLKLFSIKRDFVLKTSIINCILCLCINAFFSFKNICITRSVVINQQPFLSARLRACVHQHSIILNDIVFQLHLYAYDLSFASTFGWISRVSLTSLGTVISIEDRQESHCQYEALVPHTTGSEEQPAFKCEVWEVKDERGKEHIQNFGRATSWRTFSLNTRKEILQYCDM